MCSAIRQSLQLSGVAAWLVVIVSGAHAADNSLQQSSAVKRALEGVSLGASLVAVGQKVS